MAKLRSIVTNISINRPNLDKIGLILQEIDKVVGFLDGKTNVLRSNNVTRVTELLINGNLNVLSSSMCLVHAAATGVLSELYICINEYLYLTKRFKVGVTAI